MWDGPIWVRDSSYAGPVKPNPSDGCFLYLVRCPRHLLFKIGHGGYSRMNQWESRRWQVQQYVRFGENVEAAKGAERIIKERICFLRPADWPYGPQIAGRTEAWPMAWGTVNLEAVLAGRPDEALSPQLLEHARLYRLQDL